MTGRLLESMKPENRKKVIRYSLFIGGIVLSLAAYQITRGGKKTTPPVKAETREVTFEPKLLEKSLFEESRKEMAKKDEEMKALKEQVDNLQKELDKGKEAGMDAPLPGMQHPPVPGTGRFPPGQAYSQTNAGKASLTYPSGNAVSPPPPPHGFPQPPMQAGGPLPGNQAQPGQPGQQGQQQKPEFVGGIGIVSQPEQKKPEGKEKEDRESRNKIFLPPSFMEATLLSGVNAPTLEAAKSQPRPIFLRIKDLAVLPNSIKTNLKGCFVIAEGNGDLSDERVHLRLVNLSCLARNGQAVINSPVKGFVIDGDGVIGLKGNVVTKMGALLGRSVMAGFFGGMGDAVKASSQTTSVSPLGSTQTIDPGKVLTAGLGSGVSTGFQKLQDFYLEMARQTFPVIEVGATKTVTLVISEGVELSIREYCTGGLEECQEPTEHISKRS